MFTITRQSRSKVGTLDYIVLHVESTGTRSAKRTPGLHKGYFSQTTRTSFGTRTVGKTDSCPVGIFGQSTGDRPKSSYQKVLEAGEVDPPGLVQRNDRKTKQARPLRALPLLTLKQVCRNGTEKELGGPQRAGARSTFSDPGLVICTSFGTGWG